MIPKGPRANGIDFTALIRSTRQAERAVEHVHVRKQERDEHAFSESLRIPCHVAVIGIYAEHNAVRSSILGTTYLSTRRRS